MMHMQSDIEDDCAGDLSVRTIHGRREVELESWAVDRHNPEILVVLSQAVPGKHAVKYTCLVA